MLTKNLEQRDTNADFFAATKYDALSCNHRKLHAATTVGFDLLFAMLVYAHLSTAWPRLSSVRGG